MSETTEFPKEGWRRNLIMVLDQQSIERCRYEDDGKELLLNEEVHIVPFPVDDDHEVIQELQGRGLLRPGKTLIQSPYDNDLYEDVALADERFAIDKYMRFSTVCRRLGAKRVRVLQVEARDRKGTHTLDIDGNIKGVDTEVDVENERLRRLRDELAIDNEFVGGEADAVSARQYVKSKFLWGDPTLRGLIEMREGDANPLQRYQLKVNLSRESQDKLSVVGDLEVPMFIDLNANFKKVVKEATQYTVTFDVEF